MTHNGTVLRTVYDFPVAAHICSDGTVHYTRLVRRAGGEPQGVCHDCNITFQYRKPKPSRVRHPSSQDASHF
jgi:hypothetical protein